MQEFNKRTWAEIDLSAIKHNLELAKKLSGKEDIMPVIKANAYGHGAVKVGLYLESLGVKRFAVASLDEAIELINAGIKSSILILGATVYECYPKLLEYDLIQTVTSLESAKILSAEALKRNKTARVHIKADTGMGRIGFNVRDKASLNESLSDIEKLFSLKGLSIEGIYTHFATSDIPGNEFTLKQKELFKDLVLSLEGKGYNVGLKHVSNSGDIVNYKDFPYDTVREGIILYGYLPDKQSVYADFKPAMYVYSVVSHISDIKKGETIGYGRTFTAQDNMKVAVIPIGYADGYSRLLSNKGKMLIGDKLCNVVGRVCMDQTMVDITGLDVKVGDKVTVMGQNPISAEDIADLTGTISYEVLCDVSPRVIRTYK